MTIEEAQVLFTYGPGLSEHVKRETVLEWIRRGWLESYTDTGEVLVDAGSVRELHEERWNQGTGRLKPAGVRGMMKERRKVLILKLLAAEPGLGYSDLARELGVNWRTVRAYMEEMRDDGALDFDPDSGEWSIAAA